MSIVEEIAAQGGLVPTHRLLTGGWTSYALTRAVRAGSIIRVRQGWYALPGEGDARLRAARVGGRLTCSSGALDWGLWTRISNPAAHVAVRPHASRLRDPVNHRVRLRVRSRPTIHWVERRRGTAFVVDPLSCLLDMVRCEPIESVIAAADCALGLRLFSLREWRRAIAELPARLRVLLADVDPASGSYWESVVRFRLHRMGITLRTQVALGPGLRVDFLIGRHLVIEIDGRQHSELGQYEIDRKRDARLSILGCRCLRFTARQVRDNWPMARASINAAIARGDAD